MRVAGFMWVSFSSGVTPGGPSSDTNKTQALRFCHPEHVSQQPIQLGPAESRFPMRGAKAMLSGINVVLVTALAVVITLYLLRRRTRLVTARLSTRAEGDSEPSGR